MKDDEVVYGWGHEHFCEPDATRLYQTEPERLNDPTLGYPVRLAEPPEPETFCSSCLQWFTDPTHLVTGHHSSEDSA